MGSKPGRGKRLAKVLGNQLFMDVAYLERRQEIIIWVQGVKEKGASKAPASTIEIHSVTVNSSERRSRRSQQDARHQTGERVNKEKFTHIQRWEHRKGCP